MEVEVSLPWPTGIPQLKRLDELLRCGICYEFMTTSMVTLCSHNYCSLCIRQYLSYKPQCPACFKSTNDQHLRNNRLLDEIITLFPALRDKVARLNQSLKGGTIEGYFEASATTSDAKKVTKASTAGQDQASAPTTSTSSLIGSVARPTKAGTSTPLAAKKKGEDAVSTAVSRSEDVPASPQRERLAIFETPKRTLGFGGKSGNLNRSISKSGQTSTTTTPSTSSSPSLFSPAASNWLKSPPGAGSLSTAAQSPAKQSPASWFVQSPVKRSPASTASVSGYFSIRSDSPGNSESGSHGSEEGEKVPCPVCRVEVPRRNINIHLDACLQKSSQADIVMVPSQGSRRKALPKLVYSLLNDKQLRQKVRDAALPTNGDRTALITRHRRYTTLYNAECDVSEPRSAAELARQVEREEREKTKATHSIFNYDRKTVPEVIEKEQNAYLKQNKNQFANLVADIKKRQAQKKNEKEKEGGDKTEDTVKKTEEEERRKGGPRKGRRKTPEAENVNEGTKGGTELRNGTGGLVQNLTNATETRAQRQGKGKLGVEAVSYREASSEESDEDLGSTKLFKRGKSKRHSEDESDKQFRIAIGPNKAGNRRMVSDDDSGTSDEYETGKPARQKIGGGGASSKHLINKGGTAAKTCEIGKRAGKRNSAAANLDASESSDNDGLDSKSTTTTNSPGTQNKKRNIATGKTVDKNLEEESNKDKTTIGNNNTKLNSSPNNNYIKETDTAIGTFKSTKTKTTPQKENMMPKSFPLKIGTSNSSTEERQNPLNIPKTPKASKQTSPQSPNNLNTKQENISVTPKTSKQISPQTTKNRNIKQQNISVSPKASKGINKSISNKQDLDAINTNEVIPKSVEEEIGANSRAERFSESTDVDPSPDLFPSSPGSASDAESVSLLVNSQALSPSFLKPLHEGGRVIKPEKVLVKGEDASRLSTTCADNSILDTPKVTPMSPQPEGEEVDSDGEELIPARQPAQKQYGVLEATQPLLPSLIGSDLDDAGNVDSSQVVTAVKFFKDDGLESDGRATPHHTELEDTQPLTESLEGFDSEGEEANDVELESSLVNRSQHTTKAFKPVDKSLPNCKPVLNSQHPATDSTSGNPNHERLECTSQASLVLDSQRPPSPLLGARKRSFIGSKGPSNHSFGSFSSPNNCSIKSSPKNISAIESELPKLTPKQMKSAESTASKVESSTTIPKSSKTNPNQVENLKSDTNAQDSSKLNPNASKSSPNPASQPGSSRSPRPPKGRRSVPSLRDLTADTQLLIGDTPLDPDYNPSQEFEEYELGSSPSAPVTRRSNRKRKVGTEGEPTATSNARGGRRKKKL